MTLLASRRCYQALNPLHSLIYFAPEAEQEFTAIGLRPGRMQYFAGRSAPMGPVGAGMVAATFFNFNPELVARHIPRAWGLAGPEAVLAARLRAVDLVLHRLLGPELSHDPEIAEAAELATRAAAACDFAGRPLAAAHADLPVPTSPHLALWHGISVLREHRGDGHLAALTAAGLDGIEALVSHTVSGRGFTVPFAQASRGWTEQDWAAALDRLRDRGLVAADDTLTEQGRELRRDLEQLTDRLGEGPYRELGGEGVERLTAIAARLAGTALANGAFPAGVFV